VSENRVLRIFRPKRDEVIGEWRKLHNKEVCDVYSSPRIIRIIKSRMWWVRHGEKKTTYGLLEGNPKGKKPQGRPRCRCVSNIKMDLVEIG
jgi:hypothetical protein